MIETLPLVYFPSTLCWIDDDNLFLEAVVNAFSSKNNCIIFDQPDKFISFLANYNSANLSGTENINNEDIVNDQLAVNFNFSNLYNLSQWNERSAEISIIIADYNMPELNGIALCRQIKNYSFKKILFTGIASRHEAISAFNEGLIDRFIQKNEGIYSTLENYIQYLSLDYFRIKTLPSLQLIESVRKTPMSDPIFINFFLRFIQDNNINEYYLINRRGCFLLKDVMQRSSYLVVMSTHDRDDFLRLHDDAIDRIGNLLQKIEDENLIPFFGLGKDSWDFVFTEWPNFLYPSHELAGRETYYWSHVTHLE